ncbi:MAG: transposase [Trichodesmium sp. MAG_R01]|nr:transposase [Trichodesmium sp. MAG_R01]
MLEEAVCEIWYLLASSLKLNKIENRWVVLKTWIKQRLKEFEKVSNCVDSALIVPKFLGKTIKLWFILSTIYTQNLSL